MRVVRCRVAHMLGLTVNRWERPRSIPDVVDLAAVLLFWARVIVLVVAALMLGTGLWLLLAPMLRLSSPSLIVLHDTPGGMRGWGLLLAVYALFLFAFHITRQLQALRMMTALGSLVWLLMAVLQAAAAVRDARAGLLGVLAYSALALVQFAASRMVKPPGGARNAVAR